MSLKAKLEAVIYAAEEPVTLSQLAALFAADALAWKAEQKAATAEAAAEADAELPLSGEELQPSGGAACEQEGLPEQASLTSLDENPAPALASSESEEPPEERHAQLNGNATVLTLTADSAAEEESEFKRQAKQRDREVRTIIRGLLDQIIASYAADDRGVEVREIAGGFRMATKPECHDAVRMFVKSLKPAMKLSLAALETLAVIAYKQPVTSPEVSEIRGVESAGVLGSLLARKLIATAGRKQVIGRPILYKTTKEFLLRFGLKDVAELPSMEEFEKMAAIELEEPEPEADDANEMTAQAADHLNPDESVENGSESSETGEESPVQETDPGAVPESADTPAEQESPVAVLPAPTPAEMAATNQSETPAETAAEPSDAPEAPALAHTLADEPQLSPEDESAALEPANDAD
jgi:segregation and condensation protein B